MDALYYDTKHCDKGDLTLDDLAPYFHLPINEASKKLGICATVLKKICRKIGISRWPHRKFKSVDMLIEKVKEEGGDDVAAKLEYLEETREMLIRQPNLDFKSVVPKHIKTARKTDIAKPSREPRPLSSPVARQTSSPSNNTTTPPRSFFSPILAAVATPSSSSSTSSSGSFHDQMMVHSQSFGQSSPDTNAMDHPSSPNHFPSSPSSSSGSESPSYDSSASTAAAPFQQSAFFESRVLPPLGNNNNTNNGSRLSSNNNRLSPILSVIDEDLEQAAVLALADMAQMSPSFGPSSPTRSASGFSPKHPNLLPPFRLSPSASVLL